MYFRLGCLKGVGQYRGLHNLILTIRALVSVDLARVVVIGLYRRDYQSIPSRVDIADAMVGWDPTVEVTKYPFDSPI